jgi:subtilisin family serine protease
VRPVVFLALLAAFVIALPSQTAAVPTPPLRSGWWEPGQVVVGLRDAVNAAVVGARLAGPHGGRWSAVDHARAIVVHVPEGQEEAAAKRMRQDPNVAFAEPQYILRLLREPNDTYFRSRQWYLQRIRMPEAWDVSIGAAAPPVAVIDSGADVNHPDLSGKLLAGWNAVTNSSDVRDTDGHGTHVSGLIAARTNNGLGIAGAAWSGRVVPVKVSRPDGTTQSTVVSAAINWAVDNGARIINLSLGGPYPSEVLRRAIVRAREHGALVVAAAGNCGRGGDNCTEQNQVEYPAAFPGVLAVGATTIDDQRASYSTQGRYVGIAAPGGDISDPADPDERHWILGPVPYTVSPSGYARFVGTSQAAPLVAATAALVWEVAPQLTADQVSALLRDTAVDLGPPGVDDAFGAGRLDAGAALRAARERSGAPTPTPVPNPVVTPSPTATPVPTVPARPVPFPGRITPAARLFLPAISRGAGDAADAASPVPMPIRAP